MRTREREASSRFAGYDPQWAVSRYEIIIFAEFSSLNYVFCMNSLLVVMYYSRFEIILKLINNFIQPVIYLLWLSSIQPT